MAKAKKIPLINEDQDLNQIDSPEEQGMYGPGGSNEGLDTDDDVEERAATMGLYTKPHPDTSEDTAPVGIAEQVNKAEQNRRGIDKNTFSDED